MKRHPKPLARSLAALAVVSGALLLLLLRPPPPHSASAGRGRITHVASAEAMRDGFEVKDLSARGLAMIVGSLGASAAVLVGIVFGMIALFAHWDAQRVASLTSQQRAVLSPPAPRLQNAPMDDLRRERERELRALQGYAWLDPARDRAHVPIGRAKQLVVGQSLDAAP